MSAWQRFLKWRLTDSGRTVIGKVGTLLCTSGFLGYVIPQTFFQDKLVKWFHVYHAGEPLPIPTELRMKAEEVLGKVNLLPREKEYINFFHSSGFDVMHLGSTTLSGGANVGIPKTYHYQDDDDIEQHKIVVQDCTYIPWDEEIGEDLMTAIVLSDTAKKFAIAREIYNVSYPTAYIYGGIATGSMLTAMTFSQWGNTNYNLLTRPFFMRSIWYSLCTFFAWGLWIAAKDSVTIYLDSKCDQLAADLGEDYIKGGIEYYEKRMLLNRTLRTLMKCRGENMFTAKGNYETLFRTKTIPLSKRLDTMKKRLTDLEKNE